MVNQIFLFLHIACFLHQMPDKQGLIAGGSHLSHKNLVSRIGIRLIFVRIIGVHRVTHFMRQGKDMVKRPLII